MIKMTRSYHARWRSIGKELGIDTSTLDAVDEDRKAVWEKLLEVLKVWLKNTRVATRGTLRKALHSSLVTDTSRGM